MSDATEAKPTPSADQSASSEPRVAQHETNLVKNPLGDASTEAPNTDAKSTTYTDAAANAATSAANTASAAASGVKDSVFSMFGGGAKKERKAEDDDNANEEPSGSSKAKKEDDDDVRDPPNKHKRGYGLIRCSSPGESSRGRSRGRVRAGRSFDGKSRHQD